MMEWSGGCKDVLTDEENDFALQMSFHKAGANVKRKYSSAEYNNLGYLPDQFNPCSAAWR